MPDDPRRGMVVLAAVPEFLRSPMGILMRLTVVICSIVGSIVWYGSSAWNSLAGQNQETAKTLADHGKRLDATDARVETDRHQQERWRFDVMKALIDIGNDVSFMKGRMMPAPLQQRGDIQGAPVPDGGVN